MSPLVQSFRHADTGSWSHVVHDAPGGHAAIIDPVLDYDAASARTATHSAQQLLEFVAARRLRLDWILETHAHADHLSAAAFLKDASGAAVGIGVGIIAVQQHCKALFNLGTDFTADGSQFDRLFAAGDTFAIGALQAHVLATPGHTADGLTYVIGDAAFIGDTLFAPDVGSARVDFPGGSAARLYHSVQQLYALPAATRVFLCHDYPPDGREAIAQTTIGAQRAGNVHLHDGVDEAAFTRMRHARDAGLATPKLLLPALQVNVRAGRPPPADDNGIGYLRLPLNQLGTASQAPTA